MDKNKDDMGLLKAQASCFGSYAKLIAAITGQNVDADVDNINRGIEALERLQIELQTEERLEKELRARKEKEAAHHALLEKERERLEKELRARKEKEAAHHALLVNVERVANELAVTKKSFVQMCIMAPLLAVATSLISLTNSESWDIIYPLGGGFTVVIIALAIELKYGIKKLTRDLEAAQCKLDNSAAG